MYRNLRTALSLSVLVRCSSDFFPEDAIGLNAAANFERELAPLLNVPQAWPVAGGDPARAYSLRGVPVATGAAGIVRRTVMPGIEGSPVLDGRGIVYTVLPSVPEPSSPSSYFGHVQATLFSSSHGDAMGPGQVVWSWTASSPLLPGHALWEPQAQQASSTRLLYVVSSLLSDGSHVLFCLDADSGVQLWRSDPILQPITRPLAVRYDGVALLAAGPFLQAYSHFDGSLLWSVNAGGTYPLSSILHSGEGEGRAAGVVVATTVESVAVVDRSGKVLWRLIQMPSNLEWLTNITISLMSPARLEALLDTHPPPAPNTSGLGAGTGAGTGTGTGAGTGTSTGTGTGTGTGNVAAHPCPNEPVLYVASTVRQQLQQAQALSIVATNVSAYCLSDRTLLWSVSHPVFALPSPEQALGVTLSLLQGILYVTPALMETVAITRQMRMHLYGVDVVSGSLAGTWSVEMEAVPFPDSSIPATRFLPSAPYAYAAGAEEAEVGLIATVIDPSLSNAVGDVTAMIMDIRLSAPAATPGPGQGSGRTLWNITTYIQTPATCTADLCDALSFSAHAIASATDGSMYIAGTAGRLLTLAACPAGYQCPPGVDVVATPCPAGSYAEEKGRTACSPCPAGYVFTTTGATNCTGGVPCPTGHFCPLASGQAVPCPVGTYNTAQGSKDVQDCKPCGPSPINTRRGHSSWASCASCASAVSCAGTPMSGRSAYPGPRGGLQGVDWLATTRGQDSTAELSVAITVTPAGLILRHSETGMMVLDPSTGAFLQLYIVGAVASAAALVPGTPTAIFAGFAGKVFAIDTASGRWGWYTQTSCTFYNAIPVVYPLQPTYTIPEPAPTSSSALQYPSTPADFTQLYEQGRAVPAVDMCNGTVSVLNITSGSAISVRTSSGLIYAPNSNCSLVLHAPPGYTFTLIPQQVELDFAVKPGKSMAEFRVDTREAIMADHLTISDVLAAGEDSVLTVLQYSSAMLPLAGLLRTTAYPVLHAATGSIRLNFVSDGSKEAAGIRLTVAAVPMLPSLPGPASLAILPCLGTAAVHAFHAGNGSIAWTSPAEYRSTSQNRTVRRGALAMPGSIAAALPDVVYFLDVGATLYSLHARSGQTIRVLETTDSPYLLPAVDPMLLSSSVLDVYYAASQIPGAVANGLAVSPQSGRLFMVQIGGRVTAREVDGRILWTAQLKLTLQNMNNFIGRPVLSPDDSLLYIGNTQGQLFALHCSNGSLAWESDLGLPSEVGTDGVTDFTPLFFANLWSPITPAVDAEGYLYTVSIYGSVYCLHGRTGRVEWRVLIMNNANGVTLLPPGAVLAFGTSIISVKTVPVGMTYDGEKRYIRGGLTIMPCRPGTFRAATDEGACQLCPTGFYTPFRAETAGLPQVDCSTALPCTAGSYCPPGSRAPVPCDPGTFSSSPGASQCISCPAGTYQPGRGSTACIPCEAGTASPLLGQRSARSCATCPAGRYSSVSGSSQCRPCEAGSYSSSAGAKACALCPVGTYSNAVGASSNSTCLPCPAGTFAVAGGQSVVSCLACPAGTAYAGVQGIGQETCVACKAGFFSVAGSATCASCPAGTYAPTEGARECTLCPRSTYQPLSNATSLADCVPCPPGTRTGSAGSTSASDCEAVQFTCPDGQQVRAGLSSARADTDCVPLLCDYALRVSGDRKGCRACAPGTKRDESGSCIPCTAASGLCLGFLSFPLHNVSVLNDTLASLASSSSTQGQARQLQAAGQQSAAGTTFCPPLRRSSSASMARMDSWGYIYPTVGTLAALACIAVLVFAAGLCTRYRSLRAESHVLQNVDGKEGPVISAPVTERWLSSIDAFDLQHPVEDEASPVKRATALGGLFSTLAWAAVLALSCILLIQYSTDNVLQVQSLEVPTVSSDGLVIDAQDMPMAQAEKGTVTSSATWWSTLLGTGSPSSSGQSLVPKPLQGVELRVVVQGEVGACTQPLQWSYAGLAGGSFKLSSVADCGSGHNGPPAGGGSLSQMTWFCDDCYLTRGTEVRAVLHWSCQSLLIEASAVNTDGSTRVLTSHASASTQEGVLSSLDVSFATLLTVQVDNRGAYTRQYSANRDSMGYQLISMSRALSHDPSPLAQGHMFVPNEHSVHLRIAFPQEALFSKVTLSEKQSPFDLISAMFGLGGMFGAFGAVFAFLEPLLLQTRWWRRMFGISEDKNTEKGAQPASGGAHKETAWHTSPMHREQALAFHVDEHSRGHASPEAGSGHDTSPAWVPAVTPSSTALGGAGGAREVQIGAVAV